MLQNFSESTLKFPKYIIKMIWQLFPHSLFKILIVINFCSRNMRMVVIEVILKLDRFKGECFFLQTILCKIFWKKKWRNQAKFEKKEKLTIVIYHFLIFRAPLPRIYICRGDWMAGYFPMRFWDFPIFSFFPNISSPKALDNSWDNWYNKVSDTSYQFYLWWIKPALKLCRT